MLRRSLHVLALASLLTACSDGGGGEAPDDGGAPDAAADAADAAGTPDGGGGCAHPCGDDPGACAELEGEWICNDQSCCEEQFVCESDAECAEQGFEQGQCTDERFACRCNEDTGVCETWFCASDADCEGEQLCAAGACRERPSDEELEVRITSRSTVLTEGTQTELAAEAFDPDDPDAVFEAAVTWSSSASDAVSVDGDGTATGGGSAGEATITATLEGGSASDAVPVHNVVPAPEASLTVVARAEDDLQPVEGHYALVARGDGEVLDAGAIPDDGIVSYTGSIDGGVDVHVLGTETDWVSWLDAQGGVLFLPPSRTIWGDVRLTEGADPEVDAEATELRNANVLRGRPSFEDYEKPGEFELTLNSIPFSKGLLDFSLESIIGPNVDRGFHPDFQLGDQVDDRADIPGGLTLNLEGPGVPRFHLPAPKGRHRVWTLGGTITFATVSELGIIESFTGGDIDFGELVSKLAQRFEEFWTAVTPTPEVPGDASTELVTVEPPPTLRVPTGLETRIHVPVLPELGEAGRADTVFVLAGALTSAARFYPIGLTAGTDTADPESNPPDGIVDANPDTPEPDPLRLAYSPMHSGLGGPGDTYATASAALNLSGGGPEAGSIHIRRAEPGAALASDVEPEAFLDFAVDTTWSPDGRDIEAADVEGADVQRILFKNDQAGSWNVWLNGVQSYTMPVPAEVLGDGAEPGDRAADPDQVLASSVDLRSELDAEALAEPGGPTLPRILRAVARASFVDIQP